MRRSDIIVIGGGIVGLSTAVKIQQSGKHVLLLEKEKSPGFHQSGRNSGVIHSGIYYKSGGLKAELCVEGNKLLYDFAKRNNIDYLNCYLLISIFFKNSFFLC